ncbi:hypothetical protein K443DRAFT_311402 [Laccaria amethystina LaAM-08-1]|uniref:Uncharacterized protein n=1 Tax=Laccaria amethystina LaAM-08-1 TaxID=1095629 RepID=A0A0C9XIL6_9AGAR|nr:hypothetical protein K443DRAFT_311402 [Laccaria amethystina LaAM-08-1]
MLKCIQTGFRQRLAMGLQPYSHASASSSRTNHEKSGTRAPLQTEPSQRREIYIKRAPVSSLDQRRLSPSDWLDLSGHTQPSVIFRHKLNRDREWQTYYHRLSNGRLPFPPRSSGFLYYCRPPGTSPFRRSPLSPHFQSSS